MLYVLSDELTSVVSSLEINPESGYEKKTVSTRYTVKTNWSFYRVLPFVVSYLPNED